MVSSLDVALVEEGSSSSSSISQGRDKKWVNSVVQFTCFIIAMALTLCGGLFLEHGNTLSFTSMTMSDFLMHCSNSASWDEGCQQANRGYPALIANCVCEAKNLAKMASKSFLERNQYCIDSFSTLPTLCETQRTGVILICVGCAVAALWFGLVLYYTIKYNNKPKFYRWMFRFLCVAVLALFCTGIALTAAAKNWKEMEPGGFEEERMLKYCNVEGMNYNMWCGHWSSSTDRFECLCQSRRRALQVMNNATLVNSYCRKMIEEAPNMCNEDGYLGGGITLLVVTIPCIIAYIAAGEYAKQNKGSWNPELLFSAFEQ